MSRWLAFMGTTVVTFGSLGCGTDFDLVDRASIEASFESGFQVDRSKGSGLPIAPRVDEVQAGAAKFFEVEDAIPDHYIVVLHDTEAKQVGLRVDELSKRFGFTARYVYETALPGFAAAMDESTLVELLAHPAVRFVEQDGVSVMNATQTGATWGIDRVDSRTGTDGRYDYDTDGAGVHAYIIDTGIRTTHNEFSGRVGNGYDAIDGDSDPSDCNGHGTHVAGTVGGTTYGVAKGVTVHGVRVLNCSGSGSNSGVIAGIDWVAANHASPAVGNMSLGGGASSAIDAAVNGAVNANVVMVVAAGNESTDACSKSPARAASAVTVGSTTNSDTRSSFSNYGTCLDLFAPGSSIRSAWYTSNSATNTISGTSMASPHVAGIAALYRNLNPGVSASAASSAIVSNATSGVVSSRGSGSPNLLAYSRFGGTTPPPPPPPNPSPCTGSSCEAYSGSLSGTGETAAQPNGTYYYVGSGTHQGWLEGPASADFDLELRKWTGSGWSTVADSLSPSSSESVTYSGSPGYYYWRIKSYSGSGSYDFWMIRP